jgi:hypothetical protein
MLIKASREVMNALERSGAVAALNPATPRGEGDKHGDRRAAAVRAFGAYALLASSFTPAARSLTRIFALDRLEDADFWAQALEPGSTLAAATHVALTRMLAELPKWLVLLREGDPELPADDDVPALGDPSLRRLDLHLTEEDGRSSTVTRVIDALSACQELYDALAVLHNRVRAPLAVAAMDSGGDKLFELSGSPELIKELKEIIHSIWALVVSHDGCKLGKPLDRIASALPVLEHLHQLEQEGKLHREQAQAIRGGLVDGAHKFMATGAFIDGMAFQGTHDPRTLLAPESRFLSGGKTHRGRDSAVSQAISALSDADLDRLAARIATLVRHGEPQVEASLHIVRASA